jgi:hypothetical protein
MTFETMPFESLTPEWAADVARRLHGFAQAPASDPQVEELWLTRDLALHIRYRLGNDHLATRIARLDVDPTSSNEPTDSARLASDLLHTLRDAPAIRPWRDDRGYDWWGDEPAGGWNEAGTGERLPVAG